MCDCLSFAPYWGPGPQPRHVPWLGIEPVTLWFPGQHSIYWATPARAKCLTVFSLYLDLWFILSFYILCEISQCIPVHFGIWLFNWSSTFVEKTVFSFTAQFLLLCGELLSTYMWVYFCSIFTLISHCLAYSGFKRTFEMGEHQSSNFVLNFQNALGSSEYILFLYEFLN